MLLMCISLMTDDVEHLLHAYYHLFIHFGEISVSFAHFLTGCFLLWSFEKFYNVYILILFQIVVCKYFLHW